jgi:CubicO group peptidase (beta-lactamase class C family)
MKLKFIILFSILILIGCQNLKKISQTENIVNIQQSIDSNAKLFLTDSTINSVSIGIYLGGKSYTGHYGELDKGKGNQPNNNSIYDIASLSKTFAGNLVAQAELDGKLNIEDNIQIYLKEDYPNLQFEGNPIKIKHLITHTSGLLRCLPDSVNLLYLNIDSTFPAKYSKFEKAYSRQKFLTDLHSVKIKTTPGSQFNYSNVASELMGHILENIYGERYETLLQKHIFKNANMPNTKIRLNLQENKNLVNGYFGKENLLTPHLQNTLWGAHGDIKSTIPDMINYMRFQLDKNNLAAQRAHKMIYQERGFNIGYFWMIDTDKKNGTCYSHQGTTFGIESWIFIYPKYDLGIYLVSNHIDDDTEEKMINLADRILNDVRKSIK